VSEMRSLTAMVRNDCLPRLIRTLKEAGAGRTYVSKVHALGAGVDPEDFRVSTDEAEAYMEKTKVEVLCSAERVDELLEAIRTCARTGHRGDGLVVVSEVSEVVSIRTGDRDRVALL
jgi:nitrogen regulatory protein P-II 1